MIILIHSSKTMRQPDDFRPHGDQPIFLKKAVELNAKLQKLSVSDLERMMHVSKKLAVSTQELIKRWSGEPSFQRAAIDSFLGDIYSGLQVGQWTVADRHFAEQHLRILSGLYGIVKPGDGICPYRLEMGYKLLIDGGVSLYDYWGDRIAATIPDDEQILNLSALEYDKVLTKYLDADRFVTPKFYTKSPKTGEYTFVAVHTKIARGALASWCIRNQIDDASAITRFDELGYRYDRASSSATPVFLCDAFTGLGLSVRLS